MRRLQPYDPPQEPQLRLEPRLRAGAEVQARRDDPLRVPGRERRALQTRLRPLPTWRRSTSPASTPSAGLSMSRGRNRATRSRSPSENSSPQASAGQPTFQVSACWPISFLIPRSTFGPTIPQRWRRPFMVPKGQGAPEGFRRRSRPRASGAWPAFRRAAARGWRQPGHPRSRRGNDALSAGRGRRRTFLDRGHARRAGRRRGVRHRHREPDGR